MGARNSAAILVLSGMLGLSGCAGSSGSFEPRTAVSDRTALAAYDTLYLEVDEGPTAPCTPSDLGRIEQATATKLRELEPGRFKAIHLASAGEVAPEDPAARPALSAHLVIDRYERGDAAARAMMAGFGGMEIAGELQLAEAPGNRALGSYAVSKRFAWGGIYGATTDIEDLEPAFSEAAAQAILGR